MTITVEAVYEDGVLKPAQPLPLKEHEKVRITVQSTPSPILEAYGVMGFKGTPEEADDFALDPDLDPLEDA